MPRTNTITPPTFDDFVEGEQTFIEIQDTSLTSTDAIQSIIFDSSWATLFTFSLILSLILGVGIIYSMLRIRQIRNAEARYYAQQPLSSIAQRVLGVDSAQTDDSDLYSRRWRVILEHVNSENANDWRQAILEADVLLDTAITNKGYTGESLGEKMKQIKRSDINTIDEAWEAHKIRNRVAHEGSNFEISHREAKRVVSLYEKVFVELQYIKR
ncbi:hypothetical protein CL644_00635 [bacterium]|nr:hypothetical protein [bacterium]|tara:strand:- start:16765 stop:17403 length:639 start_codon:yes stop_codon:yes gene_type:complete